MKNRVSYDRKCFFIDGKPAYFSSGEIHYFRVEKSEWRNRFQLLKDTHCDCIATYIPWRLHEPQEGVFVFDQNDGITDITDFLKLAQEENIKVIVRPGPYSYSELMADGLPDWLVENYPEILAKKKDNSIIHPASVSYMHPVFMEKVRAWYKEVCEIIRPFLDVNGGPVIMFQLDNETTGVHAWRGSIDYNCDTIGLGNEEGRLCRFLKERYKSIDKLNSAYGTTFDTWSQYDPRKTVADKVALCRMDNDYGDFYCEMLSEYMQFLATLAAENQIVSPLCQNAGFPLTAYFKESIRNTPLLLGCDHYWNLSPKWQQNNPTPQKLMENLYSCRMLEAMGFPAWIPEFQYGNISEWPSISAEDLKCSLFAHLAFGMKGHNGYIFAGGANPPKHGWSCKIYDYSAPVSADGETRPTYDAIKEFCGFVEKHPELLKSDCDSDINVLFDWDAWRPGYPDECVPDTCGREKMRLHCIETVFPTLMCAGIMPQIILPEDDFVTDKVLCAVSGGAMAESLQKKLADFVIAGGSLILWGAVPRYDENYNSCTVLADTLKLSLTKIENVYFGGVDFSGSEDAIFAGEFFTPETTVSDCTVLARDSRVGTVAAYLKQAGKGKVLANGCLFSFWRFSHAEYFAKLFTFIGGTIKIKSSNPWLVSVRRRDENGKLWMFFINASSSQQFLSCSVSDRGNVLEYDKMSFAPMQVKIFCEKEQVY